MLRENVQQARRHMRIARLLITAALSNDMFDGRADSDILGLLLEAKDELTKAGGCVVADMPDVNKAVENA